MVACSLARLDTGNSFKLDKAHSTMLPTLPAKVDHALRQSRYLLLTVLHRSLMDGAARLPGLPEFPTPIGAWLTG